MKRRMPRRLRAEAASKCKMAKLVIKKKRVDLNGSFKWYRSSMVS